MSKQAVESLRSPEYDLLIKLLREARESRGIGQRELSRLLQRSHNYVYKIESGSRRLDVVELLLVLEQLSEPPLEFLTRFLRSAKRDG